MHLNLYHLLLNCLNLYYCGGNIESNYGSLYYGILTMYLVSTISICHHFIIKKNIIILGYSGVIYGILSVIFIKQGDYNDKLGFIFGIFTDILISIIISLKYYKISFRTHCFGFLNGISFVFFEYFY
jgi:membrane associated rhomboid family serine protease